MAADREALNRAFWDLGLRFQWDEPTFARLSALPDLRAQLVEYLKASQPHLLGVYDVELLGRIIEERLASPSDSRMGMEAHRSV
jgi:hypothetical protein